MGGGQPLPPETGGRQRRLWGAACGPGPTAGIRRRTQNGSHPFFHGRKRATSGNGPTVGMRPRRDGLCPGPEAGEFPPQFWDDHCGRDKARPVTRAPAIELTPQIAPTRHHFSFRRGIASFFQRGIAAIAGSEAGTAVAIGTFARPVTGPPAIELALEISAGLRYSPVQYMPCRAMCGPGPTLSLQGRT